MSVRVRLETYAKSAAPPTEYDRQRGLLVPVSASGSPEAILERSLADLERARPAKA